MKRKLEISGESDEALMSLYEASQLRMEGEDVLDDAEFLSQQLLKEKMKFLNYDQAITIRNTLAHPHHKSFARLTDKHIIRNVVNGKDRYRKALQELAILDSGVMRTIHERESSAVSRWDVVATEELPDYMQKCFGYLHKITNEIGYKIYKKHRLNPIDYLKISVHAKLRNARNLMLLKLLYTKQSSHI